MRYFATSLLLVLLVSLGQTPAALAIPADELLNSLRPMADVNDYARLLTPEENAALEARCRQLREKTGAQLAVVTLPSLDGGQIDDFANKLFQRWGIGEKGKNNGLLLIVSMQERKYRLEVGYGLEPIMPDILAARILDQRLRPRFRQMQYAAGLADAVNSICDVVEKGEPADREALAAENQGDVYVPVFFLALFVMIGSLVAGIGWGVRTVKIVLFGVLFAGFAFVVGMAAAFPLAPLLHFPVAIAGLFVGRYLGRNSGNISGPGSRRRSSRGTDWMWGAPSSGGWRSSGGGGGFSTSWGGFGGGSSGGGGASGGW